MKVVTSIIPEVRISTRSENFHAKVRGKEILRDTEGPDRATKVLQLQHGMQKRIGNARATCSPHVPFMDSKTSGWLLCLSCSAMLVRAYDGRSFLRYGARNLQVQRDSGNNSLRISLRHHPP